MCCNVAGGPPEDLQPLLGARGVVKRLASVRVLMFTILVITTIGVAGIGLWIILGTGLYYVFVSSFSVLSLTLRQECCSLICYVKLLPANKYC